MKLKRVYVEICNTCNLSCSFCTSRPAIARKLNVEQLQQIFSQVRHYSQYVYLHVLGEPLMHPDIETILSLCKEAGLHVQLTTNGTLLKEKLPVLLRYPPRQINISVHSYWEQPDSLAKNYLDDILSCGDQLSQSSYISYRLWQVKGADEEDFHTKELLQAICKHYAAAMPQNWKDSLPLANNRFLSFDRPFVWPSLQHPVISVTGRCKGLLEMVAILSDGSVVPCCLDAQGSECLGNIFEETLEEILEKPHTVQLREAFRQGKISSPLCQRCSYRTRFDKK